MKKTIVFLAALMATMAIQAQRWSRKSYTDSNNTLNYWLVSPSDAGDNLPVIVYLHDSPGKGDDLGKLLKIEGLPKYIHDGRLGEINAIIVIPQLPEKCIAWKQVSYTLRSLVLDAAERFHANKKRIALTGNSVGGTGTWDIAFEHPDIFSRIAPLSGRCKITENNLQAMSKLHVWAVVGSKDGVLGSEYSLLDVQKQRKRCKNVKVKCLMGYNHSDVVKFYLDTDEGIINWLINGKK